MKGTVHATRCSRSSLWALACGRCSSPTTVEHQIGCRLTCSWQHGLCSLSSCSVLNFDHLRRRKILAAKAWEAATIASMDEYALLLTPILCTSACNLNSGGYRDRLIDDRFDFPCTLSLASPVALNEDYFRSAMRTVEKCWMQSSASQAGPVGRR